MSIFKFTPALIIALLVMSSSAFAMVFGGSNLGIMGYPKHSCSKPYKPFEFTSQFEVDNYNRQLAMYIGCIKEYVENANNDIERIQEAAKSAIDEAKSL